MPANCADILVTEIFDSVLLGEGMLPTLRHARQHLLTPGAVIVPHSGSGLGAGVLAKTKRIYSFFCLGFVRSGHICTGAADLRCCFPCWVASMMFTVDRVAHC
jgi:hypothetical protein